MVYIIFQFIIQHNLTFFPHKIQESENLQQSYQ